MVQRLSRSLDLFRRRGAGLDGRSGSSFSVMTSMASPLPARMSAARTASPKSSLVNRSISSTVERKSCTLSSSSASPKASAGVTWTPSAPRDSGQTLIYGPARYARSVPCDVSARL